MSIVTLNYVKQALRIAEYDGDGDMLDHEDDGLLTAYVATAQEAVYRYLKDAVDPEWTDETAPFAVRQAVVIAVQGLYDPDQRDLITGFGTGDPKNPIVALLYAMRRPSYA